MLKPACFFAAAAFFLNLSSARALVPNDPLYDANQYALRIMNVPAAWD